MISYSLLDLSPILEGSDASVAFRNTLDLAQHPHFAPHYLDVALEIYRREFKPSPDLKKPYAMIGGGVYAADSDEEARRLFTSAQLQTLNLIRGNPTKLQPPNENIESIWSEQERAAIEHRTKYAAVGSLETIQHKFEEILEETRADEIIVTAQIFDYAERLRSFEMAAGIFQKIKRT